MSGIIHDGFFCGLNVPKVRDSGLPRFAEAVGVWSKSQILEVINDPSRTPARKRFGGNKWIKSQGRRGSCQGYGSAKALERAFFLAGRGHVPLSGEYLYSLCNGGRDSGSALSCGMKMILEHGVAPESMVQHETYLRSQMSREAVEAAPRFKADECYAIESEIELATALAKTFICVVAVHVGGSYSSLDRDGVRGSSTGPGNHCTGCDDLKHDGSSWQFNEFGSWGLNNGQGGYAWLEWNRTFRSTINYHQFYAIRVAGDDPQGDNPPAVRS